MGIIGMSALRIDELLVYNALNGQELPIKTLAHSVDGTMRKLTQPTDVGGRLGWCELYTMPRVTPWWKYIGVFRAVELDYRQDALPRRNK